MMNRASVMKMVNLVIEHLLFCDDVGFVDDVVAHIVDGCTFDEEEIRTAEEAE